VQDLIASILLTMAGATALALAARFVVRQPVRVRPFATALILLVLYWVVVVFGAEAQNAIPALSRLKWNWVGKIITATATLSAIVLLPGVTRAEAGLTLRQAPRSLLPALVCLALVCALSWGAEAWANDGRSLSLERLAFQATMPGLDEEPFFRGLFLVFLMRAFDERGRLFGAPVGPAAVVVTFIFAAGHGLAVHDGRLSVDWASFALTGAIGFGLLWIRQRTGSLLLPVLAHNLVNVGNSFF
jgi:hypothetical protein